LLAIGKSICLWQEQRAAIIKMADIDFKGMDLDWDINEKANPYISFLQ